VKTAHKDMARDVPSREDRRIREGDIVVTAVADHYAIGRMTMNGETQESLGAERTRAEALQRACALAGTAHRVFLYWGAGTNAYFPFNCADLLQ
jgi:hypothetical protein